MAQPVEYPPVSYPTGRLVAEAILALDGLYGPESEHPLPYHNSLHSLQVVQAIGLIGRARHLPQRQLENALIAGAFHDIEHGLEGGLNEEASAEIAIEAMEQMGVYEKSDYREVRGMILATRATVLGGKIVQSAETELDMIIADADLSALGRPTPEYWEAAVNLYKEHHPDATLEEPLFSEFVSLQVGILEKHTFYLRETSGLYPYQRRNLQYSLLVASTHPAS